MVLLGDNSIDYIQEKAHLRDDSFPFVLRSTSGNKNGTTKIPERIISYCIDEVYNSAVYFITENLPSQQKLCSFVQVENKT